MKIGMTSLTFRNHSIEEVIRIAKKADIDGIEWGVSEAHAFSDDNLDKIKCLSGKAGIEVFSLGSYCLMTDWEDCRKTVDIAVRISAPVIRVWAGHKSPWDCLDEEFEQIVENTKKMAEYASQYHISLGFEHHKSSLTETAESAVKLIKAVNCKNVGLYWQNIGRDYEENMKNIQMLTPYLTGIFHLQNYSVEEGYLLLESISDKLAGYLEAFKSTDYKALIEFVKDDLEENFYQDVSVLKEILKS